MAASTTTINNNKTKVTNKIKSQNEKQMTIINKSNNNRKGNRILKRSKFDSLELFKKYYQKVITSSVLRKRIKDTITGCGNISENSILLKVEAILNSKQNKAIFESINKAKINESNMNMNKLN